MSVLPLADLRGHFLTSVFPHAVLRGRFLMSVLPLAVLRGRFLMFVLPLAVLRGRFLMSVLPLADLRGRFLMSILPLADLRGRFLMSVLPLADLRGRFRHPFFEATALPFPRLVFSDAKIMKKLPFHHAFRRKSAPFAPILCFFTQKRHLIGRKCVPLHLHPAKSARTYCSIASQSPPRTKRAKLPYWDCSLTGRSFPILGSGLW